MGQFVFQMGGFIFKWGGHRFWWRGAGGGVQKKKVGWGVCPPKTHTHTHTHTHTLWKTPSCTLKLLKIGPHSKGTTQKLFCKIFQLNNYPIKFNCTVKAVQTTTSIRQPLLQDYQCWVRPSKFTYNCYCIRPPFV